MSMTPVMQRTRNFYIGATFVSLVAVLTGAQALLERTANAEGKATVQAPRFEVDPMWPKPLPNHWRIGMTIGVSVDAQDHVWIIHRPKSIVAGELHAESNPPASECCIKAPPIIEFDKDGNVIGRWGGSGQGY